MTWSKRLVEWTEGDTAFLSVVFSWQLPDAYQRAVWLERLGYHVRAGGPAVSLNPNYLADVAEIGGEVDAISHHNPNATFTTRGCIRHCKFCAVWRTEGELRELPDDEWTPKPLICDNNLLASSRKHFNHVIDRLGESGITGIDFNQGLDARLLTVYHAERLAELHESLQLKMVRLAWNDLETEQKFRSAFSLLRDVGIPADKISVYVLLGYRDTPEDALYRLIEIRRLEAWPNPMRYQPLNTSRRNSYVASGWTERELKRFTRYWSRLIWLGHIPFEEYRG